MFTSNFISRLPVGESNLEVRWIGQHGDMNFVVLVFQINWRCWIHIHRWHTVYPIPRTKTNKYRSFIHYALAKYQ